MNKTYLQKYQKHLSLLVLLLFTSLHFEGSAQTVVNITTTGAGTFKVPCDVTSITVECWGGGGAGGGETANTVLGGGGGAGGSYASSVIPVTANSIINYYVGAGGTGTTGAGPNGEGSWFVNAGTLYAQGGQGGTAGGTP